VLHTQVSFQKNSCSNSEIATDRYEIIDLVLNRRAYSSNSGGGCISIPLILITMMPSLQHPTRDVGDAEVDIDLNFSDALEQSIKSRRHRRLKKSVILWDIPPTTVHEIKSLDDYTDEERCQTWFTREEFADIKASYRELIHRMSQRENIQDTDDCSIRGLEGRSRAGSKNRQEIIVASILAVLKEQTLQKSEGRNDPETLAIAYRTHSYHSLQAASIMGRRDEAAIVEYTGRSSHYQRQHLQHYGGSSPQSHLHRPQLRPGAGNRLNIGLQGDSRRVGVGGPAIARRPTEIATRPRHVVHRRAAAA
jgi:hypothetical protein